MASQRDIRRSRIQKNAGSILQDIFLAEVEDFTTIAAPPVLTPEAADYNHADLTARDAEATPADGEISYVLSNKKYYKYVVASTSWVRVRKNVITEAHVFPADRGFLIIQGTRNKRGFEMTGPEDSDVSGFEGKVTVSLPALDEDLGEFLEDVAFKNWIVLFKNPDGRVYQMGSKNDPAIVKLNTAGTGTEVLNYQGAELSIMSNQSSLVFYNGVIPENTD